MFSFRQKIFFSYVFAFIIFLILIFPLASVLVRNIVISAMENRSHELIERIQHAANNEALVRTLKDQKALLFFRVSVITNDHKVLYDSHTKRLLGPRFSQEYVVDHPEVLEAFETGRGYNEDYSDLLGQKFAYMAIPFDFHGKTYVLRTAFPYRYVTELQSDFELGFLALATIVLLLFSTLSWIIINHFTRPIQQIIERVKPYQEGASETLPYIQLKGASLDDDFNKLAYTLNSLSERVQKQIDSLKLASNEKEILLESLTEGVLAVDANMKVTFANQSACRIFNMDKDSLAQQTFPKSDLPRCFEILTDCLESGTVLTDSLELDRKGDKIYLNIVAAPTKDKAGALLVLQDRTQDVKILEMRKEFIANASHELKTPITIIRGFAETLHDNADLPRDLTTDITGKIVRNCERMTNVVKDLLALADIENLPVSRLEEVNLLDLMEKCKQVVLEVYKDAEIAIHSPLEAVKIIADPDLLEMALFNLINNAAKYSNPPAHIDISIEKQAEKITIKVLDKGIGISKQDIPRLFERFFRVNKAYSRRLGGSGLGLSIVQTIIKKHYGQIFIESELGQGSTFTVTLPEKHTPPTN